MFRIILRTHLIHHFEIACTNTNLTEQMKQHCQHVICLVEDYLKHITSIYTEQKQIRVKRALDKCKVSKLETFCKTDHDQLILINGNLRKRNRIRKDSSNSQEDEQDNQDDQMILTSDQHLINEKTEDEEKLIESLSKEELQMLAQENDQLFDELNALTDEVK